MVAGPAFFHESHPELGLSNMYIPVNWEDCSHSLVNTSEAIACRSLKHALAFPEARYAFFEPHDVIQRMITIYFLAYDT